MLHTSEELMIEKNGYQIMIKIDVLNPSHDLVPIEDFTDQELIHFSKYDCERQYSKSALDGLKTSQRKCLFACF